MADRTSQQPCLTIIILLVISQSIVNPDVVILPVELVFIVFPSLGGCSSLRNRRTGHDWLSHPFNKSVNHDSSRSGDDEMMETGVKDMVAAMLPIPMFTIPTSYVPQSRSIIDRYCGSNSRKISMPANASRETFDSRGPFPACHNRDHSFTPHQITLESSLSPSIVQGILLLVPSGKRSRNTCSCSEIAYLR